MSKTFTADRAVIKIGGKLIEGIESAMFSVSKDSGPPEMVGLSEIVDSLRYALGKQDEPTIKDIFSRPHLLKKSAREARHQIQRLCDVLSQRMELDTRTEDFMRELRSV